MAWCPAVGDPYSWIQLRLFPKVPVWKVDVHTEWSDQQNPRSDLQKLQEPCHSPGSQPHRGVSLAQCYGFRHINHGIRWRLAKRVPLNFALRPGGGLAVIFPPPCKAFFDGIGLPHPTSYSNDHLCEFRMVGTCWYRIFNNRVSKSTWWNHVKSNMFDFRILVWSSGGFDRLSYDDIVSNHT